ncbi:hypothetical protein CSA17_06195 [bacterium DOLJORAL78_65_58]|nr:MAG: hypothetical protein CSB20_07790 [bacterium DOLZORAL124_64_63]PIE75683.1 MAG: hypothetical protein CSA17_06195 [bacterium DOLJORAL78_65_58]
MKKLLCQGIIVVLLLAVTGMAQGAEPPRQEIKLRDGKTLRGVIRQIRSSLYLVQTKQDLYELCAEDIVSVGGQPGVPPQAATQPLDYDQRRVVLHADGTAEVWVAHDITNNFDRVLTYAMFGAKERELPSMRTMAAYDQFGNKLNVRIEPRTGTDLYNVFVDFVVPVLPGETMRGSLRTLHTDRIQREGKKCRYGFWGNMPGDRLLTRRVELPLGAKLTKVEPRPNLEIEHEGRTIIVWRRYYPALSEFPLVVEYELPGE